MIGTPLPGTNYNQLQKYLRHCTFWLKWPAHDLVFVTPHPPRPLLLLSKLLVQDHAQNLEEQL